MNRIERLSREVLQAAAARGVMITLAESCTGGLVAAALTEIPGASSVVERGFVTYSNAAKSDLLGVDPGLIRTHGAVSEEVACEMVRGAQMRSPARICVSVTGVAGPSGATSKPEGLVHLATIDLDGRITTRRCEFGPIGRAEVRRESVETALEMLLDAIEGELS